MRRVCYKLAQALSHSKASVWSALVPPPTAEQMHSATMNGYLCHVRVILVTNRAVISIEKKLWQPSARAKQALVNISVLALPRHAAGRSQSLEQDM